MLLNAKVDRARKLGRLLVISLLYFCMYMAQVVKEIKIIDLQYIRRGIVAVLLLKVKEVGRAEILKIS